MDFSPSLVLAGLIVGLMVGLTGMGGGALMTPILVLIFKVDPVLAIGSDLVVSLVMKPFGAAVHHKAGTIQWGMIRWLVPFAVPAGFAGAYLIDFLGNGDDLKQNVKYAIGTALLLAVIGMIARILIGELRNQTTPLAKGETLTIRPLPTAIVGVIGGLIVGLTSVGSGSLIIVCMMLIYPRLRAKDLVGTDLFQAIPLVGAAALGHLLHGSVAFTLTGTLLLGAIPGTYLGAKLSTKAPNSVLKWVLAVLLLGSGLTLLGIDQRIMFAGCIALAITGMEMTSARTKHPLAIRYRNITRLKFLKQAEEKAG